MSTLSQFSIDITADAEDIPDIINTIVKTVASEVARAVITNTPVDTALARSNWLASLNEPLSNVIPPHYPGSHLGVGETANAFATIELVQNVVKAATPEQAIWLNNNVPYITILNDGHSKQAPAAFVELAIVTGIQALQKVNFP